MIYLNNAWSNAKRTVKLEWKWLIGIPSAHWLCLVGTGEDSTEGLPMGRNRSEAIESLTELNARRTLKPGLVQFTI